jgi:hypothetical protein
VLSVASAAILLQMALMYLFSALFKTNSAWLHGQALAGILENNFFASPLGTTLLKYPHLLSVLTWATLILEWVAPFLLFFPKATARLRFTGVAGLAAMHIGIAFCLDVDLFSPVCLAGLALFLPAEFWNSPVLSRRVRTSISLPRPSVFAHRPSPVALLPQAACLLALIYVIGMNINGLPSHPLTSDPPVKKGFFWTALGLAQHWSMFDEAPSHNGWYVAWAKLRDGSEVDLLRRGASLDWNKPRYPAAVYPNYRWRKCFREMSYEDEQGYQVFRMPAARFLCRDWDARNSFEKQIAEFDLIYCLDRPTGAADSSSQISPREQLVHLDFGD